jgi:hypothetical protein
MAMAIPSAATLNERCPIVAHSHGADIHSFGRFSVHVSHAIGSIAPHATLAFDGAGKLIERDHASRFDAYVAALQHIAGML